MTDPDAEPHFARRVALYNQAAASPWRRCRPLPVKRAARHSSVAAVDPGSDLGTQSPRRPCRAGGSRPGHGRPDSGARFVELDGDEHILWLGDSEALCGEIEGFVTGIRPHTPEPGVVRAILQSDIEGSTVLCQRSRQRTLG